VGAFNLIGALKYATTASGVAHRAGLVVSGTAIIRLALKILEVPINRIQHDKGMKFRWLQQLPSVQVR
jgi:hypothetical protein